MAEDWVHLQLGYPGVEVAQVHRMSEQSDQRSVEPLAVFDKDSFQHMSNLIDILIKFSFCI